MTLEGPMKCKEIKPVSPKENQPWILIGRTDAEEVYVDWLYEASQHFLEITPKRDGLQNHCRW